MHYSFLKRQQFPLLTVRKSSTQVRKKPQYLYLFYKTLVIDSNVNTLNNVYKYLYWTHWYYYSSSVLRFFDRATKIKLFALSLTPGAAKNGNKYAWQEKKIEALVRVTCDYGRVRM